MKRHSMHLLKPDYTREPDLTHGYIEMLVLEGWPSPVPVLMHKHKLGWATTDIATGGSIKRPSSDDTRAIARLAASSLLEDVGWERYAARVAEVLKKEEEKSLTNRLVCSKL